MKKLMYALSATLLFVACSKDDAPATEISNLDTTVLLRKSIETSDNGNSITYLYNYTGKKINSIINQDDSGEKTLFTYTGDLITKIEEYEDNELVYTENYFYKNGKIDYIETVSQTDYYDVYPDELYSRKFKTLKSNQLKLSNRKSISDSQTSKERQEFIYNNDGTITVEEYTFDYETETYLKNPISITNKVVNNQIVESTVKSTEINEDSPIAISATIKYAYDDQNNPLRNVIGLGNTLDFAFAANNITSISFKTDIDVDTLDEFELLFYNLFVGSFTGEGTFSYTYNEKGFPKTGTYKIKSGNTLISSTSTFEY